jgi:VWFA-related protein
MKSSVHVGLAALLLTLGPPLSPAAVSAQEAPPAPAASAQPSEAPPAEEEAPAFPSEIELVTVDVVVVDKEGRAVPGFGRADFVVKENGVQQTLTSFQAVELPPLPPPRDETVGPVRVASNQSPVSRVVRTFIIVYDDIHLSPAQALRAKAAIGEFLRTGVRDGDRVSLIATGGSAWWSARMPEGLEALTAILQRLDGRYVPDASPDRMTDYEAMRIMVYDDPDVGYQVERRFDAYGRVGREREGDRQYADTLRTRSNVGIIDPYVRSRAQEVYRQAIMRRKITMEVMTRALRSLEGVRGRKAMILVSQGFVFEPGFKEMRLLVDASLRVNVPIHFIDTRGLKALPDFMTASFMGANLDVQDTVAVLADITREAEGSVNVALDTGGLVVRDTNDLETGIKRVSAESQAYYLLGYNPTNTARDGKFRKIEVEFSPGRRPKDLEIRARRGYYAPSEGETITRQAESDPEIVRALDSPFELREVPLRMCAFAFDEAATFDRVTVLIAAEIDIRDLAIEESEGRYRGELAFLIEVQHLETGEYYRTDEKIEMAMLPETFARLQSTGHTVSREFALAPGGYQAKVVVRDLASGKIGSVIHDFDVPSPEGFRVSTPLISDALERKSEGANGPARPVVRVRPILTPGSTMWVQYTVLGAERDDSTYLPRVTAGYEIRRLDGTLFKRAPATRIQPTSIGALLRLKGINLSGIEPGEYELVLKIRDEIAEKDLEMREPFSVTAG